MLFVVVTSQYKLISFKMPIVTVLTVSHTFGLVKGRHGAHWGLNRPRRDLPGMPAQVILNRPTRWNLQEGMDRVDRPGLIVGSFGVCTCGVQVRRLRRHMKPFHHGQTCSRVLRPEG